MGKVLLLEHHVSSAAASSQCLTESCHLFHPRNLIITFTMSSLHAIHPPVQYARAGLPIPAVHNHVGLPSACCTMYICASCCCTMYNSAGRAPSCSTALPRHAVQSHYIQNLTWTSERTARAAASSVEHLQGYPGPAVQHLNHEWRHATMPSLHRHMHYVYTRCKEDICQYLTQVSLAPSQSPVPQRSGHIWFRSAT